MGRAQGAGRGSVGAGLTPLARGRVQESDDARFIAVFGSGRGHVEAEHDTLAAPMPSPRAQAELARLLSALKPRRSAPEPALAALRAAGPADGRPLLMKLRGALAQRATVDALEFWRFVYAAFAVDAGFRDERFADTIVGVGEGRDAVVHVWPRGVSYLQVTDAPEVLTACGLELPSARQRRLAPGEWSDPRTDRCRKCVNAVKSLQSGALAELSDPVALYRVLSEVRERAGRPQALSGGAATTWRTQSRKEAARLLDVTVPVDSRGLTELGARALWETLPGSAASHLCSQPLVLARAGVALTDRICERLATKRGVLSPEQAQDALMLLMPDPALAAAGHTAQWLDEAARAQRVEAYRSRLRELAGV